jgi:hypothetical protein
MRPAPIVRKFCTPNCIQFSGRAVSRKTRGCGMNLFVWLRLSRRLHEFFLLMAPVAAASVASRVCDHRAPRPGAGSFMAVRAVLHAWIHSSLTNCRDLPQASVAVSSIRPFHSSRRGGHEQGVSEYLESRVGGLGGGVGGRAAAPWRRQIGAGCVAVGRWFERRRCGFGGSEWTEWGLLWRRGWDQRFRACLRRGSWRRTRAAGGWPRRRSGGDRRSSGGGRRSLQRRRRRVAQRGRRRWRCGVGCDVRLCFIVLDPSQGRIRRDWRRERQP